MLYCVYCGKSLDSKMRFCPYCGKELPLLEESNSPSPVQILSEPHTAYTYVAPPTMSNAAKTMGNLSFVFGIAALGIGAALVVLMLIYLVSDFSMGFNFELLSVPLGVAAIIFCSMARKRGNYLKKPILGRLFAIIGLALTLIGIILFFVYAGQILGDFIAETPGFSA